jgi:hypothetical protein
MAFWRALPSIGTAADIGVNCSDFLEARTFSPSIANLPAEGRISLEVYLDLCR